MSKLSAWGWVHYQDESTSTHQANRLKGQRMHDMPAESNTRLTKDEDVQERKTSSITGPRCGAIKSSPFPGLSK